MSRAGKTRGNEYGEYGAGPDNGRRGRGRHRLIAFVAILVILALAGGSVGGQLLKVAVPAGGNSLEGDVGMLAGVEIEHLLRQEGGNMTRVAEKTGLERTHLYRKLKQLGVEPGKLAKKNL